MTPNMTGAKPGGVVGTNAAPKKLDPIITGAIITAIAAIASSAGAALLAPEDKQRQQKMAYSNPGVGNVGSSVKNVGDFMGRQQLGSDIPRASVAAQLLKGV